MIVGVDSAEHPFRKVLAERLGEPRYKVSREPLGVVDMTTETLVFETENKRAAYREAARLNAADTDTADGPYRVDVKAVGETTWASNALRFDTVGEAEAYALNLAMRWTSVETWRVVPESTPERETIVPA